MLVPAQEVASSMKPGTALPTFASRGGAGETGAGISITNAGADEGGASANRLKPDSAPSFLKGEHVHN